MPDWSYHVIFKPLLSRLSPFHSREFIHRGMNRIASFPGGHHIIHFLGREESSNLLEKEIDQLHFSNSVGLSGKIDPLLSGTKAFANLGFGFIEIGPVTLQSRADGNRPIFHRNERFIEFPEKGESTGLVNTIQKLKNGKWKQPIFVHLAGSVSDQLEMIKSLTPFADAFITTHLSIPNVIQKEEDIELLQPIYFSIPATEIIDEPLKEIKDCFSGIILEEQPNKDDQTNLLNHLKLIRYLRECNFTKTIITVGGVQEPADALQLFNEQAECIMLSGGYIYSGPGLPKRIKEAQLDLIEIDKNPHQGWGWYFLFALSIFIGGLITLLISMTAIILPYDEYFLEMERQAIYVFNERILYFMAHDRMTLAGTMISGGILYLALATFGVRQGLKWAKQAIDIGAITGFLGIFLFIGYGYFDWLHLIFWLVLLPFYVTGFVKTRGINGTPTSTNRRNHNLWKRSLFGQLAFVILGFSFVLGGLIISYMGVTSVFVATDLQYICMPPEMIQAFNDRLIPVIAHDRAGFGGALLSVGLLILVIALWGFQQGNSWVWWTLFLGGIPAFTAGIAIHFAIGYTNFIHLLPAYFALMLYVVGLVFSYSFLNQKNEL
ncbi:dihydroorotate dehydrogenase [Alkalihalobacterium alkalinitrilicum]|uniref:dihydroorotate dehydrogenase n=1 Tax=Alkalihalobacterium alkalinitrilicum TaxID=427920 RepID=UPI000994E1EA|nr:dihydroorotate dehydrogenase [Alkalihalobacterium alkalinitrilicum]